MARPKTPDNLKKNIRIEIKVDNEMLEKIDIITKTYNLDNPSQAIRKAIEMMATHIPREFLEEVQNLKKQVFEQKLLLYLIETILNKQLQHKLQNKPITLASKSDLDFINEEARKVDKAVEISFNLLEGYPFLVDEVQNLRSCVTELEKHIAERS